MTELWEGQRVPMTFLGGYLGAGKTTVVNHVLSRADRRVAVLVNDVGAVDVDASLIAAHHDDTIELSNGCVCCSLVDGFAVALETLRQRPVAPDHVLVELSGVAEPARVRPWASTAGFELDAIVVAADADGLPARARDRRLAGLVQAQLEAADLVLVTKSDLASRNDVDALLDLHAKDVPRIAVVDGCVDPAVLLGPGGRHHDRPGPRSAAPDGVHAMRRVHPPSDTAEGWRRRLDALPDDVVRVKGVVPTPDGALLVQRVGPRTDLRDHAGGDVGLVVIALGDAAADAGAALLEGPP